MVVCYHKNMTFPRVPTYSKSQINNAGKVIRSATAGSSEYLAALKIINEWRTCHAYPLNTFNATLRRKTRKYNKPIVAQRLKRLPTIVDKLNPFPEMELARMQDIGGLRAVVNTIEEVRALQSEYQDTKRFTHELSRTHDYITHPKLDGYRGVHLIYKYNNSLARNGLAEQYKGLAVELQIRTQLQHTWATAVETMGTLRGESYKTAKGSKKWLEFFALVSSAFAHVEDTPLIPKYAELSARETYERVRRSEAKLNVLQQISGLSVAAEAIHERGMPGFYNLIVLNSKDRSVRITFFPKDKLSAATNEYAKLEAEANPDSNLVLVSAGRLDSLKAAYPNYFLDVRDFIEKVRVIIEQAESDKM